MTLQDTTIHRPSTVRGSGPRRSLLATAADLPEARWAGLAVVLFAIGGLAELAGAPAPLWWTLYLACYAAGGWEPALAGLQALREKKLDVDVLMIVAAIAAAAIGQVLDGALLIVIFSTSGALEAFVTRRTADSVGALLELAPEQVTRLDDDGSHELVHVEDLAVGDVILVRPGERIGADGVVVDGASDVDQATITGEPMPVTKAAGAQVFTGTVNGTGALRVRVEAPAHASVVARIVTLVEEASETKAKTQLFIEKVEERYSIVVVAATILILAIPLIAGAAFQPSLLRAMTFMIVASPCAVVLATMPPLLAAIANAGRHGVLIKSAIALEKLRTVDLVAFDKTGTLTLGTPTVVDVQALADLTPDQLLQATAAAEHDSEHPISGAIVAAARARNLTLPPASEFRAAPGRGVTARVNGRTVRVGSPVLLDDPNEHAGSVAADDPVRHSITRLEEAGHTVVVVILDGHLVGLVELTDQLRESAGPTVARLENGTIKPVLLTGDHDVAARRVGNAVGISDVRGSLLPHGKAEAVGQLKTEGHSVMLVGDGINDAPAMATADVAVAMGRGGSDLALETADIILVHDDISTLPSSIDLAQRSHRVVKANIAFAVCVIAALVAWDFLGHLPLPLGVAGHEGSTIVVGLNGLRMLRKTAWDATPR